MVTVSTERSHWDAGLFPKADRHLVRSAAGEKAGAAQGERGGKSRRGQTGRHLRKAGFARPGLGAAVRMSERCSQELGGGPGAARLYPCAFSPSPWARHATVLRL